MEATAAGAHRAWGHSVPAPAAVFRGRYLSITSYRRDGTPVATPVWFVQAGGLLLVATDASSCKVKRIRRNPHVAVAICTARGRLRSAPVTGQAWLLPDSETARVRKLIARKYRFELMIVRLIRAVLRALGRGRPPVNPVIVAIRPD